MPEIERGKLPPQRRRAQGRGAPRGRDCLACSGRACVGATCAVGEGASVGAHAPEAPGRQWPGSRSPKMRRRKATWPARKERDRLWNGAQGRTAPPVLELGSAGTPKPGLGCKEGPGPWFRAEAVRRR
eukprot:5455487-Alexandrium_andersonii.AAC.1